MSKFKFGDKVTCRDGREWVFGTYDSRGWCHLLAGEGGLYIEEENLTAGWRGEDDRRYQDDVIRVQIEALEALYTERLELKKSIAQRDRCYTTLADSHQSWVSRAHKAEIQLEQLARNGGDLEALQAELVALRRKATEYCDRAARLRELRLATDNRNEHLAGALRDIKATLAKLEDS